ncbi:MAG: hypothetical protein H6934_12810 [Burkholderiaceae bacterium]|nr:hypothetical protein [Burkholderiaceae bacterium]
MNDSTLPFAELEDLYDRLAEAIDAVDPGRRDVFLTKLALCLAHELGDRERIWRAIDVAGRDL